MAHSAQLSEFWKIRPNNSNNIYVCNVCRLCANVSDNVVPIFDKSDCGKGSVYDKLRKCLPSIPVRESDIKPKQICVSCISKLDLCVSFIEMSLDTDSKFDSMLTTRVVPPALLNANDRLVQPLIANTDLSWLQIKSEPRWDDVDAERLPNQRCEPKLPHQSMGPAMGHHFNPLKSYQTTPPVSLAQFKAGDVDNSNVFVDKRDGDRNFLQNFSPTDDVPPQDLIVFVGVKNKERASATGDALASNKKNDLMAGNVPPVSCEKVASSHDIESIPSRLIDTAGNLDISGLAEEAQNLLSAFENDLLNALKAENSNDNLAAFDYGPTKAPDRIDRNASTKMTADAFCANSVATVTPADSIKKSPPVRDFSCSICGRSFTRRNRLNAHIARHSSERPHSCDKCDQRFITRWDLTLHLRIHSGVFSCEYCGKAFPAKGKLERHRRTHTGERPFPCTLCSKAFSEKRNLENHLKTHAAANARKSAVAGSSAPPTAVSVAAAAAYANCGHVNAVPSGGGGVVGSRKSAADLICQKLASSGGIGRNCVAETAAVSRHAPSLSTPPAAATVAARTSAHRADRGASVAVNTHKERRHVASSSNIALGR